MKKKFSLGRVLLLIVLIVYTLFLFFPILTIYAQRGVSHQQGLCVVVGSDESGCL